MSGKTLYLIGGPNGAGKSTLASAILTAGRPAAEDVVVLADTEAALLQVEDYLNSLPGTGAASVGSADAESVDDPVRDAPVLYGEGSVLYLDGDKVTRAMQLRNPGAGDVASQMPAIFDYIIETTLAAGRSLALETNFHSQKILERVQAAKTLGYRVELCYITLSSVHLAHQRVRGRVARGGLGVSNTEILKRYQAGIRMVGKHYALFDRFVLIDNSLPGQPNVLAEYAGGGPVAIHSVPDWAKEIFPFLTTQ